MSKKNKEQIAEKNNFKFKLEIEQISDNECKFTLFGRHYSANDVNRWLSFKKRNAYKNSIRQAFIDYFEEKGFIKDDSRKHLFELPNFEIISSEYKMEVFLKQIKEIPTMEEFLKIYRY